MSYVVGQRVYVMDKVKGWLAGDVTVTGPATCSVRTDNAGTLDCVDVKNMLAGSDNAKDGIADMLELDVLNIASILHNLRSRHASDQYYTTVGSILCCVNPFKKLDIYTPEILDGYIKADLMKINQKPPHIFAAAKTAYETMMRSSASQSVVISGESGAGKTEATKLVLKYLTSVSGATGGGDSNNLEAMILDSNPILEAFGNAKTVRNNNSSRFGKFFEVQFDRKGVIVGGTITNYLLEKSRVVHVAANERNYHVFYQFCAGASDEEKAKYRLRPASEYHYLAGNGDAVLQIPGVDDKADYAELCNAFKVLKFSDAEVDGIKRLLAAILALGNVAYKAVGEGVEITTPDFVTVAAELMEWPEQTLKEALTIKTMSTATNARRGSVYKIPLKFQEANDCRDAMSKVLYGAMFNWLVWKITESMKASAPHVATIGVLDIFGFEVMPVNSFEQLCINFANEKLHQQFVNYVFKLDMEEYAKEELPINIPFKDNAACVDMVERKNTGILAMLQEQVQLGQRGSDKAWVERMHSTLDKTEYYIKPRLSQTTFIVKHYAGDVEYESGGCLEKNKDVISTDMQELLPLCSNSAISQIFLKGLDKPKPNARQVPTVANHFKEQLTQLVTVLGNTQPHYIRCLKPTEKKEAGIFEGEMMLRQLSYSGVLETIQVRKAGYAVRMEVKAFEAKYSMLVTDNPNPSCDLILGAAGVKKDVDWVMGKSKVFLKNERVILLLEKRREEAVGIYAIILQKYLRRHLARKVLAARKEAKRRKEEEERRQREEQERLRREAEEAEKERERQMRDTLMAQQAAEAEAAKAAHGDVTETTGLATASDASVVLETAMAVADTSGLESDSFKSGSVVVPKRSLNPLEKPIVENAVIASRPQDVIPDEPVTISGWLAKEGRVQGIKVGRANNWKKRFFQLQNFEIKYFEDETKTSMKGESLVLDANSVVGELSEAEVKKMPMGFGQHFFYIVCGNRELKVVAERESDKKMWIQGLTTAVRQIQKQEGKIPDVKGKLAKVSLPDGSSIEVDVKPETTAKHVFLAVIEHVGVRKGLQYFALIEEKSDNPEISAQRVLSESENIYERLNVATVSLAFKKVVFVDRSGIATITRDNPTIMNFEYSQAVHDMMTYYHADGQAFTVDDCLSCGALLLRCRFEAHPVANSPGALLSNLHEYLPYFMMSSARAEAEASSWEAAILSKAFGEYAAWTPEQCKIQYVQLCLKNPLYGSSFYSVRADNKQFFLGVNAQGLHLIDYKERMVIHTFQYDHIVKWGRSPQSFNVIQGDQQWIFETVHGEEINKFMGIYVRMLVDLKQREAAGKA